jgi:prepilin-type N-terminal cleavage/methylation domain-containing protein
MPRIPQQPLPPRRAFTLIELLVVIGIIAILAGLAFPAIRTLTKSNDQSQAVNVVRSLVSAARNIAISQHRMAGVVFFEETPAFSKPVNNLQTAMQLIVEDFDQRRDGTTGDPNLNYSRGGGRFCIDDGMPVFVAYTRDRQYLPKGVKVATLSDIGNVARMQENTVAGSNARVILFDADGQLILQSGLTAPDPAAGNTNPGDYPKAYGDWGLLKPSDAPTTGVGGLNAYSSPGVFIYSRFDFENANLATDADRTQWLINHSDVLVVNTFTGNMNR